MEQCTIILKSLHTLLKNANIGTDYSHCIKDIHKTLKQVDENVLKTLTTQFTGDVLKQCIKKQLEHDIKESHFVVSEDEEDLNKQDLVKYGFAEAKDLIPELPKDNNSSIYEISDTSDTSSDTSDDSDTSSDDSNESDDPYNDISKTYDEYSKMSNDKMLNNKMSNDSMMSNDNMMSNDISDLVSVTDTTPKKIIIH